MFVSTVLNYIDRQAMALVGPLVSEEFGLDPVGFGWLLAVFGLSYAFCQLPAGYLADRLDVRWTYAGAVAWWSLAGIAAAFAPSLIVLMLMRAVLGVGEAFNWPCALKTTSLILPPADRSLGNGIFNSGAAVGAIVTPLLVAPLAHAYGWRTAFIVTGTFGFVWVAGWLVAFGGGRERLLQPVAKPSPAQTDDWSSEPLETKRLSTTARVAFTGVGVVSLLIALSGPYWHQLSALWCAIASLMFGVLAAALVVPQAALKGAAWAESLGEIVRLRRFWVLVVVSISINVCWHCLINWLPTYLATDRRMTFLASGLWSAVPFIAADVGNLGGGALSRSFARSGLGPSRARIMVMGACALLVSTGALVGRAPNNTVVILLLATMALGTAAFMANYFAFTQDVSPRHTGLIVGILGGLGNLCVAGFLPLVGRIKVQTGSFALVFLLIGLLPFVGLGTLVVGWGEKASKWEAD
jgi:ACS family hexuronate transporter-like MFS transporter